jgi:hypothetical protein
MLCALLIFDGPDLPAPLSRLSPWLDQTIRPLDEVRAIYGAQRHRRFIKTHTPLDGLPLRDDVTYVVVGRDPRDAMVSMDHHVDNMDRDRVLELRGRAVGNDDLDELPPQPPQLGDPVARFRAFVTSTDRSGALNLRRILHHLDTAWQRRAADNVIICHYADYTADLTGELVRLAAGLDIPLDEQRAAELAPEASLPRMQDRAAEVVPNADAIWKDTRAFLRAGGFGEWRTGVSTGDLTAYDAVVAETVAPDLGRWVHEGRLRSGIDPTPR